MEGKGKENNLLWRKSWKSAKLLAVNTSSGSLQNGAFLAKVCDMNLAVVDGVTKNVIFLLKEVNQTAVYKISTIQAS